jgi:hypothetical protein
MSQRPAALRTVAPPPTKAVDPKPRARRAGKPARPTVDPATDAKPRDPAYSTAELEFMQAMQEYKQSSGRMFPTWSEVLEVLKALGYAKPE